MCVPVKTKWWIYRGVPTVAEGDRELHEKIICGNNILIE